MEIAKSPVSDPAFQTPIAEQPRIAPSRSLAGKVALITAAGQGIGRAAASAFADAGATVWATDINPQALQTLVTEHPHINIHHLDVTQTAQVEAVFAEIGPLSVLFNCAGFVHQGSVFDCSDADLASSFDINVASMARTCRAALPGMVAVRSGSIINMSSVCSSVKGAVNRFAYGATKAAVIGLTKSIAADFVQHGIRCNALCPGTTETPSLNERISAQGNYDTVRAAFIARQPMGRLGTAVEIASAALYLASDESSFMTGQALVIDGGWSI